MAHGRDKYQSRKNRARVHELFMREWDPIGVAGIPGCAGEYDAYADKAYVMLMDDNAPAEVIAAYLLEIATEYIGCTHTADLADRCDRVARTLVGLRPEFETDQSR